MKTISIQNSEEMDRLKEKNKVERLQKAIEELRKYYGTEIRDINDIIADVFNGWVVLNTYIRDLTYNLEKIYSQNEYSKEEVLENLLSEIYSELSPVASQLEIANNWYSITQARKLINEVASYVAD